MVGGQTETRNKTSIRRADYILMYQPDLPLAVIEAKRNKFSHKKKVKTCQPKWFV